MRRYNKMQARCRGYNRQRDCCLRAGCTALRGVTAIAMSCVWGVQAGAQQTDVPGKLLEPIIITAKKQEAPKTDEEVTKLDPADSTSRRRAP